MPKSQNYQVECPNCGRYVNIIPKDNWDSTVKLYVPACPYCAHNFKMHIRNKRDLAEYIKYPTDGIEDDIPEEEETKEEEW